MNERHFSLKPFPTGAVPPLISIEGSLARLSTRLTIRFLLIGDLTNLSIPCPSVKSARRNRLWEETCFELFVGEEGSSVYLEFNLSPSGDWNVYRFTAYREGMEEETAFASIPLDISRKAGFLSLTAALDLQGAVQPDKPLEAAISAVIKHAERGLTYWALAHRGQMPDFHRRDAFIIRL